MLRKFLVIIGFIVAFIGIPVVLIAIMSALRPKQEEKKEELKSITLAIEHVQYGDQQIYVRTNGVVMPRTEINLSAQISGKIVSLSDKFQVGGAFKKGEVLVSIEDIDYRLAISVARSQVAQASQALRREEAESKIAKRDWQELKGNSGEKPSELALRLPQLRQARAAYDAAKSNLAVAELNLRRTKIVAPFNGRVKKKLADIGQIISLGTPLGKIFSSDIAQIRLPLSDEDMGKLDYVGLNAGTNKLPVIISAIIGGVRQEWIGKLVRIDSVIDSSTRLIYAIAEINEPLSGKSNKNGAPLVMGLFVEAVITGKKLTNSFLVPREAIRDITYVYTVDKENILQKNKVRIIDISDQGAVINEGISASSKVVVSQLNGALVGSEVKALSVQELADEEARKLRDVKEQSLKDAKEAKDKKGYKGKKRGRKSKKHAK